MRVHIITNCSSTRLIAPKACVRDLPDGLTNEEAVGKWVEILESFPASTTPREQYRGQGFLTLLKTLTDFKDTIVSTKIVTGGLGLTDIDESIVPYDFSGSPKEEHNITQKVTKEPFSLNVWWSMINRIRNPLGSNPVATYIESLDDDERVIISCSKIFLKYIAQDFLSANVSGRDKCKILLTASSIGSVPMQLRPYIVSFERASIQHIPGNRNDINHRAMYAFLQKATTLESFDRPAYELSDQIFESVKASGASQINIEETLKSRSDLLQLDPERAYKTLYQQLGPFGGRQNFKGTFLKVQKDLGLLNLVIPDDENDDDALDALGDLNLAPSKPSVVDDETSESLQLLQTFISALRRGNPTAQFTPADVCTWAERYTEKKELKLPEVFTMPIKLAYFLKAYYEVLELVNHDKTFSLK